MTSRQLAEWAEEVYSLPTKPDNYKLLDSDYIFDPNMSVNWNISQVDKHNLEYMKKCQDLRSIRDSEIDKWKKCLISYIQSNVNRSITESQAEVIYSKAYEDGHAYGFHDVMINVDELIEFVNELC